MANAAAKKLQKFFDLQDNGSILPRMKGATMTDHEERVRAAAEECDDAYIYAQPGQPINFYNILAKHFSAPPSNEAVEAIRKRVNDPVDYEWDDCLRDEETLLAAHDALASEVADLQRRYNNIRQGRNPLDNG